MVRKVELTSQERVRMAISRQTPDRVPVRDSPWAATLKRWHQEGLPETRSREEYFGYDLRLISADLSPRFPVRVLEENEEYIVETTPTGGHQT